MNKENYSSIVVILIIVFIIFILTIGIFNCNKLATKMFDSIYNYNNPIIPEGFKTVDTENAKWVKENNETIRDWNKGLVIEDSIGNQFVWVPIDLENLHYNSYYISNDVQYKKELLDIQNDEDLQILKYGGFYVSRYEAGVPEEMQNNLENISANTNDVIGIPVSRKDSIPWNYISAENARKSAKNMYQLNSVKSDLLTNRQWQAIMQWLNGCGYDVYETSLEWGNYSNVNFRFSGYYSENYGATYKYTENKSKEGKDMILSCGATDRNMANNIYDLAGNLREYLKDFDELNYFAVGGYYDYIGQGAYNSVNYYNASNQIGFRVVLVLNN